MGREIHKGWNREMTPPDAGRVEEIVKSAIDVFERSNLTIEEMLRHAVTQALTTHVETLRNMREQLFLATRYESVQAETIRRLEGEVAQLKEDAATLSQAAWITANKRAEAAEHQINVMAKEINRLIAKLEAYNVGENPR